MRESADVRPSTHTFSHIGPVWVAGLSSIASSSATYSLEYRNLGAASNRARRTLTKQLAPFLFYFKPQSSSKIFSAFTLNIDSYRSLSSLSDDRQEPCTVRG